MCYCRISFFVDGIFSNSNKTCKLFCNLFFTYGECFQEDKPDIRHHFGLDGNQEADHMADFGAACVSNVIVEKYRDGKQHEGSGTAAKNFMGTVAAASS